MPAETRQRHGTGARRRDTKPRISGTGEGAGITCPTTTDDVTIRPATAEMNRLVECLFGKKRKPVSYARYDTGMQGYTKAQVDFYASRNTLETGLDIHNQ